MTPIIQGEMASCIANGSDPTEFHWFDISGLRDDLDDEAILKYRPPFKDCVLVWGGNSPKGYLTVVIIVSGDDPEEGIELFGHSHTAGSAPKTFPSLKYRLTEKGFAYRWLEKSANDQLAGLILNYVQAWYAALSQGYEAYVPEVKPTFTNRRKIAQGKKPLYEWRTVVISPQKPHKPHQGGTHAPPRQHDRRGHLRRLRNGRSVWVRPCKVGNPALGTVFHDYVV
jgi:hypothetical protein